MTTSTDPDRELKARQRTMWALGDYPALADDLIASLGSTLVRACDVGPGDRVLDIAAGSGNAAIPAALAGADVVASDLTPSLLVAGQERATRRGAALRWEEADAEALPSPDGAFDVVLSCLGVMFAPHHERAAAELVRVCRPGGRLGLLSWTPEGFIGQMFAAMKPFQAPPPAGAQPPPLWGREDHVRALLGDTVDDLAVRRSSVRIDRFATPEAFRDDFATRYGPTIAAYRGLAGDPERTAALDHELVELTRRHLEDGIMEWEYLLVTARRSQSPR